MTAANEGDAGPTAVVLSGGGVRGAYEVGVLLGMLQVLELRPSDPSPFQIFVGSSVGAINASFLASRANHGDLAVDELVRVWCGLDLRRYLRVHPRGWLGWSRRLPFLGATKEAAPLGKRLGRSFLDPAPMEALIRDSVAWGQLRANVRSGDVSALVLTALEVGSGRTTMFAELAEGVHFKPSRDPRRRALPTVMSPAHVLASSAIPLLFPARQIGDAYYCDGSLRFNTPIAPAIRSGARRLVIVALRYEGRDQYENRRPIPAGGYSNPALLLGKLLNALLLDPLAYDLHVLERFNRLLQVLDTTLDAEERQRVDDVVTESRGQPYRSLDTLVFRPSRDIGVLAGEHLRDFVARPGGDRLQRLLATRFGSGEWESDLASYLLFDGKFAARLIDLGQHDALAARDRIRAFFDA